VTAGTRLIPGASNPSGPDGPGRPATRGDATMKHLRLSTLLLLIVIVAQGIGLYVYHDREARLQAALALYRNGALEEMLERLRTPMDLSYPEGMPLGDLIKRVRMRTTGPKLGAGIPIYVDPVGLQEAGRTMYSEIQTPPTDRPLTLDEFLNRVLRPLGLAHKVEHGLVTITSVEALDQPLGDTISQEELYRRYRDVLR
jgi:hypothetical protein